jgi:hypothetical protein
MNALAQSIRGELHRSEEQGVLVIEPTRAQVYLRYAFTELGADDLFFPELLLDDWGHEIGSMELYHWIRQNGARFPRAELFGCDQAGNERQYFLRELDLISQYPCFGLSKADDSVENGVEINFIVRAVDEALQSPWVPAEGEISWPLSNAAVKWWRVDSKKCPEFVKLLLSSTSQDSVQPRARR